MLDSKTGIIRRYLNINGIKKLIYAFLYPLINLIRSFDIKIKSHKAQKHYASVIKSFRNSGRSRINFAAYVVFDSTYGMDGVFKRMLNDLEHWNPMIVVIPDVVRGMDHEITTYRKTKEFFVDRYGKEHVLDGWDPVSGEYFDHLDKFDIVYYANPYDEMVHDYHKICYGCSRNVLPIYVSYGFEAARKIALGRLRSRGLNLVWKVFTDTTYTYNDYKKYQIIKGKNVVLAGYSKMDELYKPDMSINRDNDRKKILISPHHTVALKDLPLSNFLKYYDLILELPDMFPDVDFVFRPHPLLFITLLNLRLWEQKDVDCYIHMLEEKGVEYSTAGDYLGLFRECDAIINDCASFSIEWLYTGKPGCFVYNDKLRKKHLTTLMNKALEKYMIAKNREDIISFVDRISTNNYTVNDDMNQWVSENIAINYPAVSDFLINEIDILRNDVG